MVFSQRGSFLSRSCLIARNLLNGLKSCSETFKYMHRSDANLFAQNGEGMDPADINSNADGNETAVSYFIFPFRFLSSSIFMVHCDFPEPEFKIILLDIGWWCTKKIKNFTYT